MQNTDDQKSYSSTPEPNDPSSSQNALVLALNSLNEYISFFDEGDSYDCRATALRPASEDRTYIKILSSDILLLIFEEYLSDAYCEAPCSFSDVDFAPWILSQVCHDWRKIVFSSSRFWTCIRVHLQDLDYGEKPNRTHRRSAATYLISQQVALSKGLPLQLSLNIESLAACPKALDILLPHRQRWRKLCLIWSLNKNTSAAKKRLMGIIQNKIFTPAEPNATLEFTLLEAIHASGSVPLTIHPNTRFPKLDEAVFPMLSPWPRNLSWSNLTDLHIMLVKATHLISALPSFINLKQLTLDNLIQGRKPQHPLPLSSFLY